jgi:hypothetical protein
MKMNSIQQLLDTLGPPPAEVCLDWAWQLVTFAENPQSDMAIDLRSLPPSSLASASWSEVLIDAQGQLSLARQSTNVYVERSIADLVHQLMEWSGITTVNSTFPPLDFATQATLAGSATTLEEKRRSLSQLIDTLQWDARPVNQIDSTTLSVTEHPTEAAEAPLPYASDNISVAQPSLAPAVSSRLPKQKGKKRIPPVLLWSGGALGLIAAVPLVILIWPSENQDDRSTRNLASLQTADSTAANRAKKKSLDPQLSTADNGKLNSNDVEPTLDSTEELTTLEATLENTAVNESSELSGENPLPSSPADTLSHLGSVAPRLDLPMSPSVDQAADATLSQPESAAESSGKTTVNTAPIEDVASILATASQAEPKVNSIDAETADAGPLTLPVQLLEIDSMLQVQEISAKIRVRQPVWQLRIASTEAFSVDPTEMQSLAEKETVRWTLTAKELKPRKDQEPTQIVVFAQLAGRRADIKWKIAASCADSPAIAVPLDGERLDKMLNMLQAYQQRLTTGVTNIKDSMELTGLSREQKSLLTAQRKAMENEGKLVTRARQIIADAGMFVSWMDRSLEMHGNLTDQIGGQSVTVLQVGHPEQP